CRIDSGQPSLTLRHEGQFQNGDGKALEIFPDLSVRLNHDELVFHRPSASQFPHHETDPQVRPPAGSQISGLPYERRFIFPEELCVSLSPEHDLRSGPHLHISACQQIASNGGGPAPKDLLIPDRRAASTHASRGGRVEFRNGRARARFAIDWTAG